MSAFHCLLPVRDEGDIICECLEALLEWADQITVFDTGSVDGTWDIVTDFASRDKRVIPLRKEPVYFCETKVRGYLFEHARRRMKEGDWFLRVDADEFHHITPPDFVEERMSTHESLVYHQYYDFQFTRDDLGKWQDKVETLGDRKLPIAKRRKYYTTSLYAEPRMCRYRSSMKWPVTVSFPFNAGVIARERLPIRHYPNRDPLQMKRRCLLRSIMMEDDENRLNWRTPGEMHWSQSDWRQFVVDADLTGLAFWDGVSDLPGPENLDHLAPWPSRKLALLRVLHATRLIRLLDRVRPGWQKGDHPQRIPELVQERVCNLLSDASIDLGVQER